MPSSSFSFTEKKKLSVVKWTDDIGRPVHDTSRPADWLEGGLPGKLKTVAGCDDHAETARSHEYLRVYDLTGITDLVSGLRVMETEK